MHRLSLLVLMMACEDKEVPIEEEEVIQTDADGDGFNVEEDCDDNDALINPAADETCDGIDNNCDEQVDEGVTTTFYADSDEDGFGNPSIQTEACEVPEGFVSVGTDCDDTNPNSFPGEEEVCDGVDNDCDDEIDEELAVTYYVDNDGDGFGDPAQAVEECDLRDGLSVIADDCDDGNAAISPLATEECDGVDNNCDGSIDEGVLATWYLDQDEDGFGDSNTVAQACEAPQGYVVDSGDCDDIDNFTNPNAIEYCDGEDNNCDGSVDEVGSVGSISYYTDSDGDGFGDDATQSTGCNLPTGTSLQGGDCDDSNSSANPASLEVCDSIDNNCDGSIDEAGSYGEYTYYTDADGDGFGDDSTQMASCTVPVGASLVGGDCDDSTSQANPASLEVCDGIDNNCDSAIDESGSFGEMTWYSDGDIDGYGDNSVTMMACTQPIGYVSDGSDCNDSDTTISPGATEVCDSIDNDCDTVIDDADPDLVGGSTWFEDSDGDGYGDASVSALACVQPTGFVTDDSDCDDNESLSNPGAAEVCDDIDNDCDGDVDQDDVDYTGSVSTWYYDFDIDGLGDPNVSVQDCAQPVDHVTNADDCDDTSFTDQDNDGLQDCEDDDIDGDGWTNNNDSDPYDPLVFGVPIGGSGTDGFYDGSGSIEDYAALSSGVFVGDTILQVDDNTPFSIGDEVLILTQNGGGAGQYEMVLVEDIPSGGLTVYPPVVNDYSSNSVVLVQKVPHYTDVTIDGTLQGGDWDGGATPIVIFRATGVVTINDNINADGQGFAGGAGVFGNIDSAYQGESYMGTGNAADTSSNYGGGGAYPNRGDNADSGGGGSYGSSGSSGVNYFADAVTSAGLTYGLPELSEWYYGSGGGGGSPDTEGDGSSSANYSGDGGDGGGMVMIYSSDSIVVNGYISANGEDGDDAASGGGEVGGGGGGSGGQVMLTAPSITILGTVTATGGDGGESEMNCASCGSYGSAVGGNGGDGRIRLNTDNLIGSTNPGAYQDSYQ
jgi:hypothetical protein